MILLCRQFLMRKRESNFAANQKGMKLHERFLFCIFDILLFVIILLIE